MQFRPPGEHGVFSEHAQNTAGAATQAAHLAYHRLEAYTRLLDLTTVGEDNNSNLYARCSLSTEQTPAGLVARTGQSLNVEDAYKDSRFTKEIDQTTGNVVRSVLASPIVDKDGVIGKRVVFNTFYFNAFKEWITSCDSEADYTYIDEPWTLQFIPKSW